MQHIRHNLSFPVKLHDFFTVLCTKDVKFIVGTVDCVFSIQ